MAERGVIVPVLYQTLWSGGTITLFGQSLLELDPHPVESADEQRRREQRERAMVEAVKTALAEKAATTGVEKAAQSALGIGCKLFGLIWTQVGGRIIESPTSSTDVYYPPAPDGVPEQYWRRMWAYDHGIGVWVNSAGTRLDP